VTAALIGRPVPIVAAGVVCQPEEEGPCLDGNKGEP